MNTGGGFFDDIDPNLTVFALANGLDLAKSEGHRRLEWFSERLERGLVIEAAGPERFDLSAIAWPSGEPEARSEVSIAEGIDASELKAALSKAIETANALQPASA